MVDKAPWETPEPAKAEVAPWETSGPTATAQPQPSSGMLSEMGSEAYRQTAESAKSTWEGLRDAFTTNPPKPDESFGDYLLRGMKETPGKFANFVATPFRGMYTLAAPLIGAASVPVTTGEAKAIHAAGEVLAPGMANKPTEEQIYQSIKPEVSQALGLVRGTGSRPALASMMPEAEAAAYRSIGRTPPPPEPLPRQPGPPSAMAHKEAADGGYEVARNMGLEMDPEGIAQFARQQHQQLQNRGMVPRNAEKTYGLLTELENPPEGRIVRGTDIQNLRTELGKLSSNFRLEDLDRAAANHVLDAFDAYMENVPQDHVIAGDPDAFWRVHREADANWSVYKIADMLDKKSANTQLLQAAKNSGMNVASAIRQGMARMLIDPRQVRGLRPDEVKLAYEIATGKTSDNLLRVAGNVAGGGGGLGTTAASMAGHLIAGNAGAVVAPAAGFGFRTLSNMRALRKANELSEMVRSRSPLAEQTPPVPVPQAPSRLGAPFAGKEAEELASTMRRQLGQFAPISQAKGGRIAPKLPFNPASIGARKAKDGHWYVKDDRRPGKYMRVLPK